MAKQPVTPQNFFEVTKRYGYWHGLKAGNMIFVAGQTSVDDKGQVVGKGDFPAQYRQVYKNIRTILETAGAKMGDIVNMTLFCRDLKGLTLPESRQVFEESFEGHYPPSAAIQISSLWHPDLLIEIQAIAMKEAAMAKQPIIPKNFFETTKRYGYWHGLKVGKMIFVAGQTSVDEKGNVVGKGDFVAQRRQVFKNIKTILEAAGARMTDIVNMTLFVRDIKDFRLPGSRDVFEEYFEGNYPPSAAIQISSLWHPDLLIEVQVMAMVE